MLPSHLQLLLLLSGQVTSCYCRVTCPSGERRANIWWEHNLSEVLLEIAVYVLYDDTSLLCSDGKVTAPRAIVALTFDSLYPVLREQQEADYLCLVLPQHSLLDV